MNYINFTNQFFNQKSVSLFEYGFSSQYIMFSNGKVYDTKRQQFCKIHNWNYRLKRKNGIYENINLRQLYKQVFGKYFYIDTIEDLPNEEWRKSTYSEKHLISNMGRIKSIEQYNARLLKQRVSNKGYLRVSIRGKELLVHRLVALSFIPNPEPADKTVVHHKDGNRLNNKAENLQWVTTKENT